MRRSVGKLLSVANTSEHDGSYNVIFFWTFMESRLQDTRHVVWHEQRNNKDMNYNGANLWLRSICLPLKSVYMDFLWHIKYNWDSSEFCAAITPFGGRKTKCFWGESMKFNKKNLYIFIQFSFLVLPVCRNMQKLCQFPS